MSVTSPDFESGAYTNFATPAANVEGKDNKSSGSGIASQRSEGRGQRSEVRDQRSEVRRTTATSESLISDL